MQDSGSRSRIAHLFVNQNAKRWGTLVSARRDKSQRRWALRCALAGKNSLAHSPGLSARRTDGPTGYCHQILRTTSSMTSSQCCRITARDIRNAPATTAAATYRSADPRLRPAERRQDNATQVAIAAAPHKERMGNTWSQKTPGSAPGTPMRPAAIPKYSANEATRIPANGTTRRPSRIWSLACSLRGHREQV